MSQCGDQACLLESDNPMALDACLIPAWRERVENGTRLQVACSSHSSPSTCTHGPDCWIHLSTRRLTAFQPLPDHLQPSDRHGANVSRAIPQPHALELEQSQSHRKQCPKDETSICISHDVEIPPPPIPSSALPHTTTNVIDAKGPSLFSSGFLRDDLRSRGGSRFLVAHDGIGKDRLAALAGTSCLIAASHLQ